MLRDVTGQRSLEHQLRQAQKMEAVGRLAGGVSHDFNNLLTAILGYADLLALTLPDDSPLLHNTDEIKAAAQRGADLTRQLLAFGRRQVLAPQTLDLNQTVLTIEKLLRRVIGDDIELVTALEEELGAVRADPSQIEQVLLNLGINARDAMPDGGVLTARTGNVEVETQGEVPDLSLATGQYVMLEIEDSGIGIAEEIKDQIFEPFFTTKSRSKGSGLGLATVYGIVRQSGGQIEVFSEPGNGSRFRVLLPRVDEVPTVVQPVVQSPGMPKGDETVLLVEDEPAVREFLRSLLGRLGYSVVAAGDGVRALEVVDEQEGRFDLLLSDVVMPRMNGVELAHHLTREHPGLRVLLISGHAEKPEALMEQNLAGGPIEFLQKPFSSVTLAHRVRRVLDADGVAKGF